MENASKALLIAAGVLVLILVLSLAAWVFGFVRDYYNKTDEQKLEEQITKFNSEYEKYTLSDVRGNDLLSLINKVVDYNTRKSSANGINYKKITLIIDFQGQTNDFYYSGVTNKVKGVDYNDIIRNLNNLTTDASLYNLSIAVEGILSNVNGIGVKNEKQLQKLTTNISNIFAPYSYFDTTSMGYITADEKRNTVVKEIIGKGYNELDLAGKKAIEKAILEYYQYQQFKRAHFKYNATQNDYDSSTGRIVRLEFKFTGTIQ